MPWLMCWCAPSPARLGRVRLKPYSALGCGHGDWKIRRMVPRGLIQTARGCRGYIRARMLLVRDYRTAAVAHQPWPRGRGILLSRLVTCK
jgi:hypothetical protein